MRVTPTITADNALNNIQQGRTKLDRLNEQISSGLNILRPSDDPITTRQILDLENSVKESDQYLSNITKANLWLKVTDTTLTGIADIIRAIKGVAATISSGTTDTTVRDTAVSQLKEFRAQLADLANTQLGEQYIFGGYKNTTFSVAGDTSNGSQIVSNVNVKNLSVGMKVSGGGFPSGTLITSIGPGNSFSVDTPAGPTAAAGSWLSFDPPYTGAPFAAVDGSGTLSVGSPLVTGVDTTSLSVGMPVTGEGIPSGTLIQTIGPAVGEITLSNNAVAPGTPSTGFPAVKLLFGGNYRGTNDSISISVTRSSSIALNVAGGELFEGTGPYGTVNVFEALDGLITAIETNNVAAINTNAASFDQSVQQVNNARSVVAGRMARLQSAQNLLVRDQNTAKGIISDRQNVDYAKAAVELTQQQNAFQATLSATAKISQLSLLDYID